MAKCECTYVKTVILLVKTSTAHICNKAMNPDFIYPHPHTPQAQIQPKSDLFFMARSWHLRLGLGVVWTWSGILSSPAYTTQTIKSWFFLLVQKSSSIKWYRLFISINSSNAIPLGYAVSSSTTGMIYC